ncbi:MAG: RnfABCDGE type electron transport complex subunit D, partial [Clostridia bacterium]|nr:RnfABCDGE type electron transport complex subunit D [Clostridia bacterium]
IVKQCFGGIGQNFANPAATARIVLLASFPTAMTTWTLPFSAAADAVSSATPLAIMKSGGMTADGQTVLSLLMGFDGGSLGEVSRLLLILGGLYLIFRRVITPTVPLAFVGTVFVLSWILGADPLLHILSGGLILGAFFMATDYATTPLTQKGKLVFGIGCGVFTVLIRLYANLPEGVSYSILLMNILTPLIERAVYPKPFGTVREKKGRAAK